MFERLFEKVYAFFDKDYIYDTDPILINAVNNFFDKKCILEYKIKNYECLVKVRYNIDRQDISRIFSKYPNDSYEIEKIYRNEKNYPLTGDRVYLSGMNKKIIICMFGLDSFEKSLLRVLIR